MKLKTVTWNVGGCQILKKGEDPTLLASYSEDGLEAISAWLESANPDIITLQEIEGSSDGNQIEQIAERLGYSYYFYDWTSDSHMNEGQKLGSGIISRFPITEHRAGVFYNPHLRFDLEGRIVETHDKGYGTCLIDVDGRKIRTATLHLPPFRKIGIELDSEVARKIFASATRGLMSTGCPMLVQGDFNIDSVTVGGYLPELMQGAVLSEIEVKEPTNPKGKRYDHVLYGALKLKTVEIDSTVETDHYPVTCVFEIPE